MMSEDAEHRVCRVLLLVDHEVFRHDYDPEHPQFTVDGRPATDDEAHLLRGLTRTDLDDALGQAIIEAHLERNELWGQVFEAVNTELQKTRDFLAQLDDPPAPSA
ncbi:MAG: hypothetical protein K0Q93_478 [Nocardioidaceae bacterium]|jgi:hypothetical protein|nr:hypothetical protein [Nocardioidaceae bacterium]